MYKNKGILSDTNSTFLQNQQGFLIYQRHYFPSKILPKYQTVIHQIILISNKIKGLNKYISISILHIQNFLKPFKTEARYKFS